MWIKVVPDASPNVDGRWIEVPDQQVTSEGGNMNRWIDTERAYRSFAPPGEHMVGVSSTRPATDTGESPDIKMMRETFK